jgi:uncharacterized protein YqeY
VTVASLPERLQAAMTEARKRRDQPRTLLLSTTLAELKNREFELKHPPSDDETIEVIRRALKRRREAAEAYVKAARQELADKELAEARMLEEWLPAAPADAEIRAAVRAAIAGGAKDLGQVMGKVMPQFKGRADGKVINQIVREELASPV